MMNAQIISLPSSSCSMSRATDVFFGDLDRGGSFVFFRIFGFIGPDPLAVDFAADILLKSRKNHSIVCISSVCVTLETSNKTFSKICETVYTTCHEMARVPQECSRRASANERGSTRSDVKAGPYKPEIPVLLSAELPSRIRRLVVLWAQFLVSNDQFWMTAQIKELTDRLLGYVDEDRNVR